MSGSTLPNLGPITGAYADGDNGWGAGMDQNLQAQDDLTQLAVKDISLSAPPGSPTDGDRYIVGPSATGAWSGKTDYIARYVAATTSWFFYAPKAGFSAWSVAQLTKYTYTGAGWVSAGSINAQTGTSYSIVLADVAGGRGMLTMNNASANTATIPKNSTLALPLGVPLEIVQLGAGQTTVAGASGVTVHSSSTLKTRAQYSVIKVTQIATDSWILSGDMQ